MSKTITMRINDGLIKQADATLEEIRLNNAAYLAKLDMAIEDAREHGVYEYLGKDENGKAIFSDMPQKAVL